MWYYSNNGEQVGPVEPAEMAQLIARGVVNANSHLWRDGMTEWQLVGATELAYLLPRPVAQGPKIVVTSAPIVRANTTQPVVQNNTQTALAAAAAQFRAPKPSWMKILFGFQGRIPRRTYWAGICIWIGIMGLMGFLSVLMSGVMNGGVPIEGDAPPEMPTISPLAFIPMLAIFPYMWSYIALQIKRWHDRGKPGVMVLVNLIPIGGPIWAFVECGCLRGTVGPNQFGKDPT